MPDRRSFDVLVVGAGPAGIAAACSAAQSRQRVGIVDDNQTVGGQLWRGEASAPTSKQAMHWLNGIRNADVEVLCATRVIAAPEEGVLLAESDDSAREFHYRRLVIATGARERFLPFPGWTLPNVTGAGGLLAMVKAGLPIRDKRVVVAGTGPLLLAVAAYLHKCGARVRLIAEQAPRSHLLKFGLGLTSTPNRLVQAARLKLDLAGVRHATGCWPVKAEGDEKLSSVTLQRGRKRWRVECDYLACGFGLVPNLELPLLLGCKMEGGVVGVDDWQQTSVPDVYCAGETTGIGGLELSTAEGQIAGHAAGGRHTEALEFFGARDKARQLASAMNHAFALRDKLKTLATPDTIVCRCEDVPLSKIKQHHSWRSGKLQTRCGMGACQGRTCGPATEFLLGWGMTSVRPPILPTNLENLASPKREPV